ncbi:MBL fold metallo-hydrolase [Auraticoccus monumenti]|uniref:Glyoxylase, beta-lactamase superfamily II n=1 Tax=Auraticoccus monumenti TaxID=675864 RepID=A0A1G7BB23_9ACTN|nr:MBL fold metallo-hydrolase [Auraticoccus monumenti]SDE23536.1 Glyoxylase, beta-lactamase superfamily II [Auraticoccus monumenti]
MLIASFAVGPWQSNCYVVADAPGGDCLVLDPGPGALAPVRQVLREQQLRVTAVVATHGHLDHVMDADALCREVGAPLWIHPADRHLLTDPLAGIGPAAAPLLQQLTGGRPMVEPPEVLDLVGPTVELAGTTFTLAEAPGHTAGCVLLRADHPDPAVSGVVFSGDVLFAGSVGRVDLPGSDPAAMARTLAEVVLTLDDDVAVLPGHGSQTSIGRERAANPFLQQPTPSQFGAL